MINLQDYIGNSALFRKFEVNEVLFTEFKCPIEEAKSRMWWHNNFFAYILVGETFLQTAREQYLLKPGQCAFAKKGSVITHNHLQEDFCEILVFVPDEFIKTVMQKYEIPFLATSEETVRDTIIPLPQDEVLTAYFHSLLTFFRQPEPPSHTLLKLKFEELIVNILSNPKHQALSQYFSEVSKLTKPSIRNIMEANFFNMLSLEEFARLCARSLSSFKQEFKAIYHTSPGKWLLNKRLVHSQYLLQNTEQNIEEVAYSSGFKNRSHFNKAFKKQFGVSPGQYKSHRHLEFQNH